MCVCIGGLIATISLQRGGLRINASLEDLVFDARLRVVLKPLCNELPCFAGIALSFITNPDMDFTLRFMGGNLVSLPGLQATVDKGIRAAMEVRVLYIIYISQHYILNLYYLNLYKTPSLSLSLYVYI